MKRTPKSLKISENRQRTWARLAPERRAELAAAWYARVRRREQLHAIKRGTLYTVNTVPGWLDEDFDAMVYPGGSDGQPVETCT